MEEKENYYECSNCGNFFYEGEMDTYYTEKDDEDGIKCPECGCKEHYTYDDIYEAFEYAKLRIESLNEKLRTYYSEKNALDWLHKKLDQYENWYKDEKREIVELKKENERLKDIINFVLKRDKHIK